MRRPKLARHDRARRETTHSMAMLALAGLSGPAANAAVLSCDISQAVLHIDLKRPHRHNALNPEMIRALAAVWQEYALRRDLRVAVLGGEGPSFCSGMDIGQTHPGFGYLPQALDSEIGRAHV